MFYLQARTPVSTVRWNTSRAGSLHVLHIVSMVPGAGRGADKTNGLCEVSLRLYRANLTLRH